MKKLLLIFCILLAITIPSYGKDTLIVTRQITGTNQHYAEVLFKTSYRGEEISMAGIMSPDRIPYPNNVVYVSKANWNSSQKGYVCSLALNCLPDTKYFWSVRLNGVPDVNTFFQFKTKECFTPRLENIELEEILDSSFKVSFRIPYNEKFSGTYFFVRLILEDPKTKKFEVYIGDLYITQIKNGFDTTLYIKKPRKLVVNKDVLLTLTVEISNGCTAENVTTEMTIVPKGEGVKVFPNPTSGKFGVSGLEKGSVINIFSIDGKLLMQSTATTSYQIFDISSFPSGIYILTDRKKVSKKIIKL